MMFKYLIAAALLAFSTVASAVGPGSIWRLDVTSTGAGGILEIGEIYLYDSGDNNVVDLLRNYAHNQPTGATTWTIVHNQDLQEKKTFVDVTAVEDGTSTPIDPDTVTVIDTNTVELTFSTAATGDALVRGSSFDFPSANRRADAVPPIEGFPKRPSAAAFDGLSVTKFKSAAAPADFRPLTIQYTFWAGTPDRFPNVASYAISAPNADTAPSSWVLMYWDGSSWVQADQRAAVTFEDGETKTFELD